MTHGQVGLRVKDLNTVWFKGRVSCSKSWSPSGFQLRSRRPAMVGLATLPRSGHWLRPHHTAIFFPAQRTRGLRRRSPAVPLHTRSCDWSSRSRPPIWFWSWVTRSGTGGKRPETRDELLKQALVKDRAEDPAKLVREHLQLGVPLLELVPGVCGVRGRRKGQPAVSGSPQRLHTQLLAPVEKSGGTLHLAQAVAFAVPSVAIPRSNIDFLQCREMPNAKC